VTDLNADPAHFWGGHKSTTVTPPRKRSQRSAYPPGYPPRQAEGTAPAPAPEPPARPRTAPLDPRYAARLATVRAQLQAEHDAVDTSPEAQFELLTQARDRGAAEEARLLLQGERMTPAEATERLAATRPPPLTAQDLQCDTGPTQLISLILDAKARHTVEAEETV
jgi:hypothetical protein